MLGIVRYHVTNKLLPSDMEVCVFCQGLKHVSS